MSVSCNNLNLRDVWRFLIALPARQRYSLRTEIAKDGSITYWIGCKRTLEEIAAENPEPGEK